MTGTLTENEARAFLKVKELFAERDPGEFLFHVAHRLDHHHHDDDPFFGSKLSEYGVILRAIGESLSADKPIRR